MATESTHRDAAEPKPPWPRWKRAALAMASVLLLSGGGIQAYAFARSGKAPMARRSGPAAASRGSLARGSGASPFATGLVSRGVRTAPTSQAEQVGPSVEGKAGAPEAEASTAEKISPILIESGLSFFIGFCIASALRAMAKIAAIGLGLAFLCVFGLQYAGVIGPIDWAGFEGPFRTAASTVGRWAGHIQSYVAHALPSGAMAGLGIAAGFKK